MRIIFAAEASSKAKLQLRIASPVLDPGSEALILRTIEDSNVGAHVTFCGAHSRSELLNEYASAQALVLASREETTPQVIAQAMACRLPTISSAVGEPHMVRDETTAPLLPFGDSTLREAMTLRIWEEARQRFHPDSVAEQTVSVYREVMARAWG